MLMILSPAKSMDYKTSAHIAAYSQPAHLEQSQQLVTLLRTMNPQQLAKLMQISDKLAALNTARYGSWALPFTPNNAKPAVLAFKGDVYVGLNAETMNADDLQFAQQHLRILSGLYGVLRPLDLMQPYRLEMGTKLTNSRGQDLYSFWDKRISDDLNRVLAQQSQPVLVNLASNEYFKAIQSKQISSAIITPVFKDEKNGNYKIISFFAKQARGLMARWAIKQRLKQITDLKQFDLAGYRYNAAMSDSNQWVFLRPASAR
jgi:cytoplasmic iron level regulating protein YaaA (DUF328/UPF0246 family)